MKKLILPFLLAILIFSCDIVKADYNGGGGSMSGGTGGQCGAYSRPCVYDNAHFAAVQISLVYYNGSTWEYLGRPVFFVNNQTYANRLGSNGDKVIYTNELLTCKSYNVGAISSGGGASNCKYDSGWFKQEYSNGPNAKENGLQLLNWMGINPLSLTREHNGEINYNSIGYRFILEPVLNFDVFNQYTKLMTVKQVFREFGGTSNSRRWPSQSTLMSTDWDDIGIKAYGSTQTSDPALIANNRSGYGYNIINPSIQIFNTCFKLVVNGENPVCKTEDKYANTNNNGYFEEQFVETDCSSGEKVEDAEAEGRLVKTVNEHCKVYCTERVDLSFPGSVLPAISKGSYFVWPTLGKSVNDKHNLKITGTRTCTKKLLSGASAAESSQCSSYNMNVNDLYKDFQTSMKIKYNDKEYKISGEKLEINTSTSRIEAGSNSNQKKIIREVTLKLPSNLYRYYDTNTKKYIKNKNSSSSTVISFGQGVLPVSLTESVIGKKNLELYDFKLGSNNVFGSKANEKTYKCVYEVTEDKSSDCICPPGTDNSGQDLWCKIANSGGENCPTAIEKYCNDTTLNPTDLICDDKPKYCPAPYQYISVESCVNAGNTYQSCVNKYCTGNPPKYECPRNDPDGGTEWMDITNCVEELMSKGHSQTSAIKICQDVVCPGSGNPGDPSDPGDPDDPGDPSWNGLHIIYRTISLRNPFPSKQLNANIAGFNLDRNGRYPGANWNSRELVKAKILNNRGSNDPEKIYTDRKPLYRIVLTPSNIQAIKNYNRSRISAGGYQDFNLKCYGKNVNGEYDGSQCLSEFLKDSSGKYGVDKSNSVCYQKRGDDFENCRNS